ncbi:helix-turn-helix domain-containing protein [Pseudomonas sp. D1-2]
MIRLKARTSLRKPIALDLGYDSPAAFSTMFRRTLGHAPSTWLEMTAGH